MLGFLALAHQSDGQQAPTVAQQLKLAAVMPRGAMVYVQAADLSALMKTWLASPVRSKFYDSASFTAFQKSRAYLKLQDRKKDIENAIGIGLDESRLAELAGRASAVSIYDIGKLEIVFVTEVARARAIASTLFKQAQQFQERSADGTSYYVRDVATDGGRLNQQFCFAYVDGKLIVTTTEGLMIRAIANAKSAGSESLSSDILALADTARGFGSHEVTMWLDQARLNRNRYFENYWIHRNSESELATIESALIDLRITRDGMTEQRWFKVGDRRQGTVGSVLSGDQVAALMKYAPPDAQLVEVRATGDAASLALPVENTLFGKLPDQESTAPAIPDRTRRSSNEDSNTRAERYSRLDSRFDIDADDEQAPRRGPSAESDLSQAKPPREPAVSDFVKSIGPILGVSSGAYCELIRSRADAGKPFVRFERALVAQLKPDASLNRDGLERAIIDELRARFVVAGAEPRLAWQDDGEVRFVAQSLLEQGAAYALSGGCLVLASSREFANDVLQAAKKPSGEKADAPVEAFALVRVAAAKPVFDTLMSKLDGREAGPSSARSKDTEDEDREVKFFSENLSSLIAASSIREMRLTRQSESGMMTERLVYSW